MSYLSSTCVHLIRLCVFKLYLIDRQPSHAGKSTNCGSMWGLCRVSIGERNKPSCNVDSFVRIRYVKFCVCTLLSTASILLSTVQKFISNSGHHSNSGHPVVSVLYPTIFTVPLYAEPCHFMPTCATLVHPLLLQTGHPFYQPIPFKFSAFMLERLCYKF